MLITPTVELPDEALHYHLVAYGKTRSGKTYAIKGILEKLLDRGSRVCVIDPTGAYYGLKSPGDGKDARGYPVVVFGGRHADVEISEHAAKPLAALIATGNVPAVIDVQLMTVGERTRFFTTFAQEIFRLNRGALHLVIDEAHLFAPKESSGRGGKGEDSGNRGMMQHNAVQLATGGGSLGIRLMVLSQRPALLHNSVASQCETLIAMRVIHPTDRAAVREWIEGCGDLDKGKEVMASLANLKRGEGWLWSPEHGVLERLTFPRIRSFDSARTPDDSGAVQAPATVTEVDLGPIRAAMAVAAPEDAGDDVKSLKRRNKELQARLDAALLTPATMHPAPPPDIDRQLAEAKASGAKAAAIHARDIAADLDAAIRLSGQALEEVSKQQNRLLALSNLAATNGHFTGAPHATRSIHRQADLSDPLHPSDDQRPGHNHADARGGRAAGPGDPDQRGDVPARRGQGSGPHHQESGPHQRILGAIDWWRSIDVNNPTRSQVAFVAGYTPRSGTFRNYLAELSSRGAIHYPDAARVALTPAAARTAAATPHAPSLADLHHRIRAKLTGPQAKILDVLLEARGREMPRTSVAELAGYEATSGTFRNYMAELSGLGLIRYPRKTAVQASPLIFPEGLK